MGLVFLGGNYINPNKVSVITEEESNKGNYTAVYIEGNKFKFLFDEHIDRVARLIEDSLNDYE